jgi:hypothetical protein
MSNTVKRKKLTKRIALRLPHATWRAIVKQARLHGITPSELVREALEHYQGHLCPSLTAAAVNATIDAVEHAERTASTPPKSYVGMSAWVPPNTLYVEAPLEILEANPWIRASTFTPSDTSPSEVTPPKAQAPGPPGGAGSASVPGPHGETEVSTTSPKRNRR